MDTTDVALTGKTVTYYTSPFDFRDFVRGWTMEKYDDEVELNNGKIQTMGIVPPVESRDWRRGLMIGEISYRYSNGEFFKVRSIENKYRFYGHVDTLTTSVESPIVGGIYDQSYYELAQPDRDPMLTAVRVKKICDEGCALQIKYFDLFDGRYELMETVEKNYDYNNLESTRKTEYYYDHPQYFLTTRIKEETSTASSWVEQTKRYPFDTFQLSAQHQNALDEMLDRNILKPVETIVERGGTVLEKTRENFIRTGNILLPDDIQKAVGNNDYETEIKFLKFNSQLNLEEYTDRQGLKHSLLWGYNGRYPVAKGLNIDAQHMFYEGFEINGDTVAQPKAGKGYHTGDYTVKLTTAQTGSILSYWYWENNTWKYKEVPYNGGNHLITDGTRIDEVRISPPGTQMITYTFDSGVGVNSITDANSTVTNYYYDHHGRLQSIKDGDGNLVRRHEYNYKAINQSQSPQQ